MGQGSAVGTQKVGVGGGRQTLFKGTSSVQTRPEQHEIEKSVHFSLSFEQLPPPSRVALEGLLGDAPGVISCPLISPVGLEVVCTLK